MSENPRFVRFAVSAALILLAAGYSRAGGPGSTSAPFLKLPTGARAIGMGETYVAVGDDVQAIGWNPAGLARLKTRQLTFMHAEWFEDIRYESLAYAQPLGGFISVGGGVDFLITSPIDRTAFIKDVGGTGGLTEGPENWPIDSKVGGVFDVSNVVVTGAVAIDASAMKLIPLPNVQAGANARVLVQKLDKETTPGAVVDLGAIWSPENIPDLRVGAVAQNVGPAMGKGKGASLPPISFRLGVAYLLFNRAMTLATDYYQPVDNYGRISFGLEYWYKNAIAMRVGYRYQGKLDLNEYKTGGLEGFSLGAGFRFVPVQIDYAFATLGFLGPTHRVSLTVSL